MAPSLEEFCIGIRLFYLFKILCHLIVTLILESDSIMHIFFKKSIKLLIFSQLANNIVYETDKAALWKESQSRVAQIKQKFLSSPGLPLSALVVHWWSGAAVPPPPITPAFQPVRDRNS